MTDPLDPLDGPLPDLQCNGEPAAGLDGGSPLFQCNEAPDVGLDGGSPLFQCNEAPASGLDAASPLIACNGMAPAALDGGSPLFLCNESGAGPLDGASGELQCNGSPPEPPPPPGASGHPGLVPALIGVGAIMVAGGLYIGGVFDGGNATPASLDQPIAATTAPVMPSATRTPGATVSPTRSPGATQATQPSVVVSGTRSPLPRPVPAQSHQPTPSGHATATQPAPTSTKPVNPSVGKISAKPASIEEAGKKGCGGYTTATITATVTDPASISSVTLFWSTGSHGSGSAAMTSTGGSSYQASVGPFASDGVVAGDTVSLTVKAKDSGGRTGSSSSSMPLNDC